MENQEKKKNKLDISNNKDNRKESQQSFTSENIPKPQNKERYSNGSNIQNTSLNLSMNNESQSQSSFQNNQQIPKNQNINTFSMNNLSNFPSKEFFNFSFFKRQMSSRSSDVDFYQENKEGINEFFNTKCKSIISRDSEKQINSKKSSELNSFEYMLPNLENKDDNNQIILTRANSARTKNYRNSNNYIPKAVFFQRNNSNNPSCFYKKHHIQKHNIKNNYEDNNSNLVIKYYGNNNEFNHFNKNILEMVNDKDDESKEDDKSSEEDDNEEDEDDDDDDGILIKKGKDNFNVNYITGNKEINLPKSNFSLFHRGTNNNLKVDKEKEKEKEKEENKEKEKIEDNKEDTKIIFGDFIEKEKIEEKNNSEENNSDKEDNEENEEIIPPKNENMFYINKIDDKDNKNIIINQNVFNNNTKNDEIIYNNINNQYSLNNNDNNKNIINQNSQQNYNQNNENNYLQFPNIYHADFNEKKFIQNLNKDINLIYNNKTKNTIPIINSNEEFLKNVSIYIKDQQGCRYIQKKIEENPEISNKLFDLLYQDIISMSKDLFGNYAIQKILENIEPNYLIKFIDLISKDFYNLAISIYGTRVVQKILEIVSKINYKKDKEIYEQCFKKLNKYITENIVVVIIIVVI